ncbi:hypothetical protein [Roseinatronobacter sp.]|uniref:hypothetical protein n=1 Tax=Roseinatronobacter sp. TaxID=1945755 RepID=UPI003F7174F4
MTNKFSTNTETTIHKEADMALYSTKTPEAATMSPRQHVAAMIDDLAANGLQGEHILQMIERRVLSFSNENKKLAFFHHVPLNEVSVDFLRHVSNLAQRNIDLLEKHDRLNEEIEALCALQAALIKKAD